jgi:hypothetical protein
MQANGAGLQSVPTGKQSKGDFSLHAGTGLQGKTAGCQLAGAGLHSDGAVWSQAGRFCQPTGPGGRAEGYFQSSVPHWPSCKTVSAPYFGGVLPS